MLILNLLIGRFSGIWEEPNSFKIKIESSLSSTTYYGYVPKTPQWKEIFHPSRIGENFRFEGEMVAYCIMKIHYVLPGNLDTFTLDGAL